jgi:hypothetical protein
MADAPDSKSGPRKGVWVQVPPSVIKQDKDLRQIVVSPFSLAKANPIKSPSLFFFWFPLPAVPHHSADEPCGPRLGEKETAKVVP